MPLFDIEDPATGNILTVDHPQAPTQEEALAVIASQASPPATPPSIQRDLSVVPESFAREYEAQQRAGPLERSIGQALETMGGLYNLGRGSAQELSQLALSPINAPTLGEGIQRASEIPSIIGSTALEVPGRIGSQVLSAGQSAIEAAPNLAASIARRIAENPSEIVQLATNPISQLILSSLSPRTGTIPQSEIERAFQSQQEAGIRSETPVIQTLVEQLSPEAASQIPPALPQTAELGALASQLAIGAPEIAAIARPLGSAIASTAAAPARAVSAMVSRVKPTATQSAISALKVTSEEAQKILPSAVTNLSKAAGKSRPTTVESLQAAPKARKSLFEETTSGLTKAKDEGLVAKGQSAVDDVIEAIQSDTRFMADQPEVAANLINRYEKYRRDMDPLEARKFLEDTNSGLVSHWDKTAKGQKADLTDAEVRAERAFAANLSEQVDNLYKAGSGKNASPYRDIGSIIEFEKSLKIAKEAAEKAFAERIAPVRQKGASGPPVGKYETARRAGRGLTTPFRKTELELLDKQLNNIFKGTEKIPQAASLSEEILNTLRQENLPSSPVSQTLPVASREQQIQQIISTFPDRLKRDPRLARIAAEAELQQGTP